MSEEQSIKAAGVAVAALSLFIAVALFDGDFSKNDMYCNMKVCLDFISIADVSIGILAIGNPIAMGIVSVSSFVAIGIIPIAPIGIGILPIALLAYGYDYINVLSPVTKR